MDDRNTDDGFFAQWMAGNERLQGMLKRATIVQISPRVREAMGEAGVHLGLAERYIQYLRAENARLKSELGHDG